MRNVAIVGAGAIAKRLQERLEAQGDRVLFSFRRNHIGLSFEELLAQHNPNAVFVAISTLDQGEAARDYILACVKIGIPVITCEKGALAYHANILKPYLSLIGYSAAVGGGTGMLQVVRWRCGTWHAQPIQIFAVINGTLNFIFSEMERMRRPLGEVCDDAVKSGFAEPGANDPLSLINGELGDVLRKTCVVHNTVLASDELVTPNQFDTLTQTVEGIERLSEVGGGCRFIVSFTNHPSVEKPKFLGKGFSVTVGKWEIAGGFRRIADLPDSSWLPAHVGNAMLFVEGLHGKGGKYSVSGNGAGAEPTTSAMLNDLNQLCP